MRSNVPSIDGTALEITAADVTAFIQADWNRVFGPVPPSRGFLLAYRSGTFAAGRLAEELVVTKLALGRELHGSVVQEVLLFSDVQERSLISRGTGVASDDLVLLLADGRKYLVESKAAFRGHAYLRRSIGKATAQVRSTLVHNPGLAGAGLALAGAGG